MVNKKILAKLFICLILYTSGHAFDRGFEIASNYFKIDTKILKIIAENESRLNPFAILLKTQDANPIEEYLKSKDVKYAVSKKYISIFPNTKVQAINVYKNVVKSEKFKIIDYDLGLMQINRLNFKNYKVNELEYYINHEKNIFLGADVLRKCFNRFQTVKDSIECYNRGTDNERFKKNNYSYFVKFIDQYKRTSLQ